MNSNVKTANAEFGSIEVWSTDQNKRPLEIEDNVNKTPRIEQININEIFILTKKKKTC